MDSLKQKPNSKSLQGKVFLLYQKVLNDVFETLWSKFHPTVGQCIATVLIFLAAVTMKGDWLLLISHFMRQFYDYSNEQLHPSWLSQIQNRFAGLHRYILTSILQSLVMYFGLCGFLQWYWYVRQRDTAENWKCQPKKFLSWEDEKHAVILGTACITMGSVISGFLSCWIANGGYTALYYKIEDYGFAYLVISIPLTYLTMELLFYYYHRMFHFPIIYKRIHKYHHRYKQPTAFSSTAMHPLEFFILQTATVIPMFLFPIHYIVYISLVLYEYYYSVIGHSGIKIESIWPWQPSSMFHDNHHEFFHVNFGLNTKLFDYLHDTLRKEDRIYSENIFYGRGKEWNEATEEEKKNYVEEHQD
ncbi:putative methylsterol monooxygenase DDB_G0269788 [Uloborus diversus]|uniref:putative methylsterol monooxygenase DDB_G0269788 n=1 Tax=Uloborus diversus TaxID=327109 RepID=UPI002409D8F6|nr:putative methylsterol monooxygenase DDB_G0269788 [Uloborus diversus]